MQKKRFYYQLYSQTFLIRPSIIVQTPSYLAQFNMKKGIILYI